MDTERGLEKGRAELEDFEMCPACKGTGAGRGDVTYCGYCGGDGTIGPIEKPGGLLVISHRKKQEKSCDS